MHAMVAFLNSPTGRILRVAVGVAMFYIGVFAMRGTTAGVIVAILGFEPIVLGFVGRTALELFVRRPWLV